MELELIEDKIMWAAFDCAGLILFESIAYTKEGSKRATVVGGINPSALSNFTFSRIAIDIEPLQL